jgi:hypothetical protein
MNEISIGYLSWKRQHILTQTLNSHKTNGLLDLIKPENRFIFFQELSTEDKNIANNFECYYFGNDKNIGILNAFIEMVEKCNTKYFIFSENDWYLVEEKDITNNILNDCIQMLDNNLCDIIRLRHSKNPGNPLYSRPKEPDEWITHNVHGFPYKLESLNWISEPNKIYNNIFNEYTGNYTWYITTLDHQKWSNNIFIANISYLKNVVLPLIKHFIFNNNKYTGLEEILINYNNYYGQSAELDNIINMFKKTKIAGGYGLFTHKDNLL